MTRQPAPPDSLRARLGAALQRERLHRGLSQAQLAKLANLSLKYIGEIERREANVTVGALERLIAALDWNPFEHPGREQDALPEGVRRLLVPSLEHMQHLVQTALGWLQAVDATLERRPAQPTNDNTPIRQRGRPRKPRATGNDDDGPR